MAKKKENIGAKLLLTIHSLVTLGYGISLLATPNESAAFMGLRTISADGQAELFVMYLGLSGSLSFFMLFGAFSTKWLPTALLVMALTMSGITFVRLAGFALLETGSYTLNALYYDIPITILSWFAFAKLKE